MSPERPAAFSPDVGPRRGHGVSEIEFGPNPLSVIDCGQYVTTVTAPLDIFVPVLTFNREKGH